MHRLAAASRPRLSGTEPKWLVFETSWFGLGDIALNPSVRKSKHEKSQHFVRYCMNSTCTLFLSMYTSLYWQYVFLHSKIGWPKRTKESKGQTKEESNHVTFPTLYIDGNACWLTISVVSWSTITLPLVGSCCDMPLPQFLLLATSSLVCQRSLIAGLNVFLLYVVLLLSDFIQLKWLQT